MQPKNVAASQGADKEQLEAQLPLHLIIYLFPVLYLETERYSW